MKTVNLIALLVGFTTGIAGAESYKATLGSTVTRMPDKANIPDDPQNKDRQEYLNWLADGNVVLAADPAPTPAEILSALRASALAHLDSKDPTAKELRGLLLVLIDELNILRQRDRDRSVDVAAAATLADLKTRWAARSSLADRNMSQVKPAIQLKITNGTAD